MVCYIYLNACNSQHNLMQISFSFYWFPMICWLRIIFCSMFFYINILFLIHTKASLYYNFSYILSQISYDIILGTKYSFLSHYRIVYHANGIFYSYIVILDSFLNSFNNRSLIFVSNSRGLHSLQ